MTITIKQVYDAYPGRDLLPFKITESTSLDEIIGEDALCCSDSLFLYLCRELCPEDDECDRSTAIGGLHAAIRDLTVVYRKLSADMGDVDHLATLMATHTHEIYRMPKGTQMSLGIGTETLFFERLPTGDFRVAARGESAAVGNVFGAMQWYMTKALTIPSVVVIDNV